MPNIEFASSLGQGLWQFVSYMGLAIFAENVILARAMGVTRASVCRAVGSLCESGFLAMEGRLLHLTEKGKAAAMANHEKQLFFEQMLQKAGVAPEQARQDACRMKHAVSDESYLCLKG